MLDKYHHEPNVSEFWSPARFNYHGILDFDVHEPWTDAFYNRSLANFNQTLDTKAFSTDGKTNMTAV